MTYSSIQLGHKDIRSLVRHLLAKYNLITSDSSLVGTTLRPVYWLVSIFASLCSQQITMNFSKTLLKTKTLRI